MNRLVLVGNGFDLAHGLKTSYRDFITDYWMRIIEQWKADEYGNLSIDGIDIAITSKGDDKSFHGKKCDIQSYYDLKELINKYGFWKLTFKNKLLQRISESSIENWVDIEQAYYDELKKIVIDEKTPDVEAIKKLNEDLGQIGELLHNYLHSIFSLSKVSYNQTITEQVCCGFIENDLEKRAVTELHQEIQHCEGILDPIEKEEFMRTHHLDAPNSPFAVYRDRISKRPDRLLILSFNYTQTMFIYKTYLPSNYGDLIYIHGMLGNTNNPIIFGYGDERGEEYQKIENMNNNEALNKMKSIKYLQTQNYSKVMRFIESDRYQVFIFGHSCGLSDRTLLQTIFEHDNCISIKPFYYTWKDNGIVKDNFMELTCNISRNFKDKIMMRDRVVNKEFCERLMR